LLLLITKLQRNKYAMHKCFMEIKIKFQLISLISYLALIEGYSIFLLKSLCY
jgi:hypothetical protein